MLVQKYQINHRHSHHHSHLRHRIQVKFMKELKKNRRHRSIQCIQNVLVAIRQHQMVNEPNHIVARYQRVRMVKGKVVQEHRAAKKAKVEAEVAVRVVRCEAAVVRIFLNRRSY